MTLTRFGSFEILAKSNEVAELRQLADFVLKQSFPHIPETGEEGYLAMFQEVPFRRLLNYFFEFISILI